MAAFIVEFLGKTYNDLRGLYYSDKSQNGFNIIDPYTLCDAEY